MFKSCCDKVVYFERCYDMHTGTTVNRYEVPIAPEPIRAVRSKQQSVLAVYSSLVSVYRYSFYPIL